MAETPGDFQRQTPPAFAIETLPYSVPGFGWPYSEAAGPPVLVPVWGRFQRSRVTLEGLYRIVRLRHPFQGNRPGARSSDLSYSLAVIPAFSLRHHAAKEVVYSTPTVPSASAGSKNAVARFRHIPHAKECRFYRAGSEPASPVREV